MPRIRVLGVGVDCVDMAGTLNILAAWVLAGGPCRQVATVNPEFVMRARRDADFAAALEQADLCLADGSGVLWAVRREGCALAEKVAGSDLVPALAERAAALGHRLFLLGAGPGVAVEAARRLVLANSALLIAGVHRGSPWPADDDETLGLIAAAGADILLVAYGAPAQDLWIARNRDQLPVSVAIGVGGTLDFVAGTVRRAPAFLRRLHLEWFYRLIRQPWRARRMAVLPGYLIRVLAGGRSVTSG